MARFSEKFIKHKVCVLIFSANSFRKFSHLRRMQRNIIMNVNMSSCKVPRYSCQILMNPEFSRKIFEKSSNIKFHENPSRASRNIPRGQTDGRNDGANIRLL